MKKFILLTLGIVAVVASVAFVAEASRYRPHSARLAPYRYHEMLKYRYRRPSASNITVKKSTANCRNCFNRTTQHATVWNGFTDSEVKTFNRRDYQVYRSMRPNLFPRHANTVTQDVIVVRAAKQLDYRQPTHGIDQTLTRMAENDDLFDEPGYSLRLPASYERGSNGTYTDPRTGVVVRANPSSLVCNALTFDDCAIKLGTALRDGHRFSTTHRISQNYGLRRATLAGKTVYYPTMIETYEVDDYGTKKLYVLYALQNPTDGSMAYVEAVSPYGNQTAVQNVMKSIARTYTFQF